MPKPQFSKRTSAWLVTLFFLALTALGLFTAGSYGQPWDEPWEQDILCMNLNQYAKVLGVADQFQPRSNISWPASGVIADSVEKDHGECAYYPAFLFIRNPSLSPAEVMTLWHMYTWLLFMVGVVSLWFICRRLGLSRLLSCAAALFLVLSPRMFAEGHYNNKDVVLLALVLLTLWQALRLMDKPTFARALLFSLAGAAATNTKIIGLPVWGLCLLAVLVRQLANRRMSVRMWLMGLAAVMSYFVFYALLTPAMWPDPLSYLGYVLGNAANFSRWDNDVLYRGAIYHLKRVDLPRSYLPYMIVVTTPLWLLALIAMGQLFAMGRFAKLSRHTLAQGATLPLLLATLLWLAPFAYDVLAQPIIYNGWRHFYFIYGPMLVLAAYGVHCAANWLDTRRKPFWKPVGAVALSACMACSGVQIALLHPNQYPYFNLLVSSRADLPQYLELDYWNVSVLSTLRSLLPHIAAGEQKTVTGSDYAAQTGLAAAYALLTPDEQAKLRVLPQGSLGSKYVLVNSTYATLNYWRPEKTMHIAVQTDSFAQPLSMIYERAGK